MYIEMHNIVHRVRTYYEYFSWHHYKSETHYFRNYGGAQKWGEEYKILGNGGMKLKMSKEPGAAGITELTVLKLNLKYDPLCRDSLKNENFDTFWLYLLKSADFCHHKAKKRQNYHFKTYLHNGLHPPTRAV